MFGVAPFEVELGVFIGVDGLENEFFRCVSCDDGVDGRLDGDDDTVSFLTTVFFVGVVVVPIIGEAEEDRFKYLCFVFGVSSWLLLMLPFCVEFLIAKLSFSS